MSASIPEDAVAELRDGIAALDAELVGLVDRRLDLVEKLWQLKREHGLPLRAPDREQWLLEHLGEIECRHLSTDGLHRLHGFVLELTRSELE